MRRDEGQTTVEWLAIAAVVAAIVVALIAASPPIARTLQESVQRVICLVTGGQQCGGPQIGDPVSLPQLPPQTRPLPFDLPDLPDFPGIDFSDFPDLPYGPDVPDIPNLPPVDLPDLNDVADRATERLLESLIGPLGPFGDISPIADEILDYIPEAGTVVDDVFPGTPAPRSDQLALGIAYGLQQEEADIRTVHCGASSSGIPVICVNNADTVVPDDAAAVTVGHVIFCETECEGLLDHEMVHVEQYEEYGDEFLPLYILESAQNGTCTDNRFEDPAYEKGGSCTN